MGVAHSVGDPLTFEILTDDTKKIIYRSAVRSATKDFNIRLETKDKSDIEPVKHIKSIRDDQPMRLMPGYDPAGWKDLPQD